MSMKPEPTNTFVREYAKESGILLWQIAEALGMRDSNFSKLLRHPLTEEKECEICSIIDRLADQQRKDGENA